ncbi:hypothetical protein NZD89_24610 [Alicyclobacillus fastidiosus]|uniref:Uncharacterized protein n=1 Tax=Alicyclobacillus fastidiosus TaxID=392011 RepID=A0ABY6ZFW7_9BACL|nr:hypothetical protein [Alicyclobacillus fastidiosus]WAH41392.1 hypothetical protein NZD89_24610 [Alicyclobacillus fastidiosus]GMA63009.1 hypothetical protein GCM10025859_34490 [Alicyclobacillus fastidiosus]
MSKHCDNNTGVVILNYDSTDFHINAVDTAGDIPSSCLSILVAGPTTNRAAAAIACLISHGFKIEAFDAANGSNQEVTLVRHKHE